MSKVKPKGNKGFQDIDVNISHISLEKHATLTIEEPTKFESHLHRNVKLDRNLRHHVDIKLLKDKEYTTSAYKIGSSLLTTPKRCHLKIISPIFLIDPTVRKTMESKSKLQKQQLLQTNKANREITNSSIVTVIIK